MNNMNNNTYNLNDYIFSSNWNGYNTQSLKIQAVSSAQLEDNLCSLREFVTNEQEKKILSLEDEIALLKTEITSLKDLVRETTTLLLTHIGNEQIKNLKK